MLLQIGTTAEKEKTMNKNGKTSQAVFIVGVFSVITTPLASFGGQRLYALSEGLPFSVLGWWHHSGLYGLAAGVITAVVISLIAWRMQKLGM